MCGKVTKKNKENDENKTRHSGYFEMKKYTIGQKHIWGSKLLVRFYFLRQMVHAGIFSMNNLILYRHNMCSFNIHYYTLQSRKKTGWNLCFEAAFKKFIYFNQRIIDL